MLIPLKDNILILAVSDPDTWYGSAIIRPESTKDRADQGIVKAVGPLVKDVRIGDYVTFSPYSGIVINDADEGDKHIMVAENGIMTIVTPPITKVPNVLIQTEDGLVEATAEAVMQLVRKAYQDLPRVIEQKQKFEGRFGA